LVAGVVLCAPVVLAQAPPPDTSSWGELLPDGAEIGVFQPSSQVGDGSGTTGSVGNSGDVVCTRTINSGPGEFPFTVDRATEQYDTPGNNNTPVPVLVNCLDNGVVVDGYPTTIYWTPADGDILDPEQLAQLAKDRLAIPAPSGDVSPSLGVGTQAQMPTYFWLDNGPGAGALPSASATAGGVTVTATATPISHTWWIRDSVRGTFPVRCGASPGAAFDGTGDPPAGTCNWTPQHSSAGQGTNHPETGEPCFAATVTVVWNVTWSGGDLGNIPTYANTCIVVHEIQAVVSEP
jgi:hypothetical protein